MANADEELGPRLQALFKATSLRQPEDAVGFLLWRVAHRYQREIDRACAGVGLTHLQFVVLVLAAWLGRAGDPLTQSGLATFSGIHPMQLSNVLKALQEKALVLRPRNAADDRSKLVALTPKGLSVLADALPRAEDAQRRFFGRDQEAGYDMHQALRRVVQGWGDDP